MSTLNKAEAASLRVVLCLLLLFGTLRPARADIASADRALQQGRAAEAVNLLQPLIAAQPSDPAAHQLLCRVYYAEELADPAIHECEQAVAHVPASSNNQMWLGRAYGLKAEHAGPFTGLSLAKKVRVAFESSAQLDPSNIPASTALGEFYIAAPSLIGGGLDKAERIASQLQRYSPAAAHRLRAMIAEKRKDFSTAESEFRSAIAEGHRPDAMVDLGAFYQRQNQPDKAVITIQSALNADRAHDAALMDMASILTDAQRSPDLAEKVLRLYLASSAKSEDAPAFKVHVQLGHLLSQHGDQTGAHAEYEAALQLAPAYNPARKALQRP
ncbi:tetratricopeptide repeat protein [Granulicella arctica]|uniref:tetratricopeptide repeat protein n=1 Tax=Granulicella arctica TaxID=940613 RepID=UPI0021E0AF9B|nr:tetratricopeptide repeat protein [Granulicella arctica]